jgi:TPR repeat protein
LDHQQDLIRIYLIMDIIKKNYLGKRRVIFLFVIAYFGLPHMAFSSYYDAYDKNVEKVQSSAEVGDPAAQFMLGKFYYYGLFFERNYPEAIKWFRAAAHQGHASAQFLLGEAYEKARGLKKDYAQAAKWYMRAAFQGHFLAMYNLSNFYAHGLGVPKNLITAYAWNTLTAGLDWDMAKSLKIELEKILHQEELNQAQILSIELKKKIRALRS